MARQPIHPMLVPFPIVLITSTLLTDIVYAVTRDEIWARHSMWFLAATLVAGALAGIVGAIDFISIDRARRQKAGWIHVVGNSSILVITLANLLLRLGESETMLVVPLGIALSAVTFGMLLVTGWYGNQLVYRYRIGVAGPGKEYGRDDK